MPREAEPARAGVPQMFNSAAKHRGKAELRFQASVAGWSEVRDKIKMHGVDIQMPSRKSMHKISPKNLLCQDL